MLHVILTICLSTTFSLMMKHAHARHYGILAVGCINYIVAGVVAVGWALFQWPEHISGAAVSLGCIGGAMYVFCYLCIMVMLERQGISVATALTRLAIALPILASIFFWGEHPSLLQTFGLVLTGAAILLFDLRQSSGSYCRGAWHTVWPLAGCFLTAGGSRLCQKAFGQLCQADERPVYIAAWFGFAGAVSLGTLLVRRIRPLWPDCRFGAGLGLVNIGTLFCVITALRTVPAIVFFPVTAVGSLVLVVVLASWAWHERLEERTCWGVVLASLALILVNL